MADPFLHRGGVVPPTPPAHAASEIDDWPAPRRSRVLPSSTERIARVLVGTTVTVILIVTLVSALVAVFR